MQSKGAIRLVAILLALACVWQLSFTAVTGIMEKKADKYAEKAVEAFDLSKVAAEDQAYALDSVRKYGACSAEIWPNTKKFYKKPSKAAYANGLKGHELTKYYRVKNLRQIKEALVKGYPVAIAMAWVFRFIDGNTWILNDPTDDEIEDCTTGHAIIIVGYDDEKKLFEIRNSWGEQWGNHGYAFITYDTMKRAIWFDDSYAVVK